MKAVLIIIVKTDNDFSVMTRHPKWEVVNARQRCDEIAEQGGSYTIETVSPDATTTYWEYGRFEKGIDVHLLLDGVEVTLGELFENYNEALDYNQEIISDAAHEAMEKYYKELEEKELKMLRGE